MISRNDGGRNESVWQTTSSVPLPPEYGSQQRACDVCVVGAGIAGMTTAYLLAREGRKVIVLDDGPIGGGETGRTTAHLVNALDDRYYDLEIMHGEHGARLAAASHTAAVDMIEHIVQRGLIDCEFLRVDGYLLPGAAEDAKEIDEELAACHRAGLTEVRKLDKAPGPWNAGPCLHFPRQAQFHPLKYLHGLAEMIRREGGEIFTGAHVNSFQADKQTGRVKIETAAGGSVDAAVGVVCTNSPINDWVAMHTKQGAYRTYVIGCRVPKGSVPTALWWDTRLGPETPNTGWTPVPYHYVRIQPAEDHDVLIVGGEDHKTGQETDFERRFMALEAWTRQRYPMAEDVTFRWSGQVMEPADGLGFIGRNPGEKNVYIATGDSGNGMTHGTIAGMLITDLVVGRKNPWEEIYDPARKITDREGLKKFVHENVNVAGQYRDYVTSGEVANVDEIERGCGAVMREGLKKLAIYRDDRGHVHCMSAVCTHLACIVQWNDTEKSWDCPCHGSRFAPTGEVINGPATEPLAKTRSAKAGPAA